MVGTLGRPLRACVCVCGLWFGDLVWDKEMICYELDS